MNASHRRAGVPSGSQPTADPVHLSNVATTGLDDNSAHRRR
jgi:hypothetical protein